MNEVDFLIIGKNKRVTFIENAGSFIH